METMKYLTLLLLLLMACNSTPIKVSDIEDCTFLSSSIFCRDKNIKTESQIERLKDRARKNTSLDDVDKLAIIDYFDSNKLEIIESQSYELDIQYHKYFLGYYLNPPEDRAKIEKEVITLFEELHNFRRRCRKPKKRKKK